jgi:hypothetical protein
VQRSDLNDDGLINMTDLAAIIAAYESTLK